MPEPITENLTPLEAYQQAAQRAKTDQAWQLYLQYQHNVWQAQTRQASRLQTALDTLKTFQALPETTRQTLRQAHSQDASLQAWLDLTDLMQRSASLHQLGLQDFALFYSNHWFHNELLPYLQAQRLAPRHYAVFLPLSGAYQSVAEQIRNGLLKYQFQAEAPIHLHFYNTSDAQSLPSQLKAASEQQVDAIIGPVQSDRVDAVIQHWQTYPEQARPILALNSLPVEAELSWTAALNESDQSNPVWAESFLFPTENEAEQVAKRLLQAQHQRIGILTNVNNRYAQKAAAIAGAFKRQASDPLSPLKTSAQPEPLTSPQTRLKNTDAPYLELNQSVDNTADSNELDAVTAPADQRRPVQALLKTFPDKRPNLRDALGQLINENESQARKNNLRWLLKEPIEFTPRPRQDLDAVVLVTHLKQLAVFRPQFDFFELTLPLYSTSDAMPKAFYAPKAMPDLAGIEFPAMNAAFGQHPAKTQFEAFGWDALALAHQRDWLKPGLCFHTTATGNLGYADKQYQRHLRWARYTQNGEVVPVKPVVSIDALLEPSAPSL
ncbi:penicillin-binding protein activator [Thiomicrospira sp. WB1]|uniref:penicillin-binding protein activator n=1 Tax=Thiomicrospira sp. WB1 TaxID=1685380 RepID=UPI000748E8FD|nr:penicillin-binding protein activator [Thiomicrospira sp. WB1]KUJ72767.1 hypothetical protein AVO41_02980 [Thiomicrospira sp. WB1]